MNTKRFWNIFAVVTLLIALCGVGMGTYNYSVTATAQGLARVTSLDVSDGNITNVGNIALDSITNDGGITTTITAANGPVLISQANAYDAFRVDDAAGDTTPFIIDASGNVGIGTAGPGSALHLQSGSVSYMTVSDATPTVAGYFGLAAQIFTGGAANRAAIQGVSGIEMGAGNNRHFVLDSNGNVGIGTTGPNTTASISGTLGIGNDIAAPTVGTYVAVFGNEVTTPTMAADMAGIYGYDVNGTTEMFAIDEAENTAQLTPHNFDLFAPDDGEPYPWSYYACNKILGKCINVDMAGAIREIETLSGKQFIYYEDMSESEILSWDEHQGAIAEQENAQRLAEAAAVLTPTLQVNAVESYPETVTQPVSPTQYITETIVTYELNAETGEVEEVTTYDVTEVTETVETGNTLYRLKEGCQLEAETGQFLCPIGDANAVYEPYQPQPMPEWMQQRTIALFLAPQDVSGLEKPEGDWKKLANVGDYAIWAGVGVEAEAGIELHETLWEMSPTETLGALAVVQTRNETFYDARVKNATGMTDAQWLARRDKIVTYLNSLGKNTTQLAAATTEDRIVRGIAASLGVTIDQLWAALQ